MTNTMKAILRGVIYSVPLAAGFVTWAATADRGWRRWGSAFAASGVATLAAVGAGVLDSKVLGLSGIGQQFTTPEDIVRAGYFGQTITTPDDIVRAGYFGQTVPRRMKYSPRGPLGAIQVSRSFRRYS